MSSEVIRLTARFKLKEVPKGLDNLLITYCEIVNYLITYAHENNITSFYRLKEETYKILREKYPELPSHYIYTACQMATSIYKSYRKRRRRGKAKGKPVFKKEVIMLDDHLFRLYLERGIVRISTPKERVALEFYPAKYHEKFRGWRIGQAWILRTRRGVFINVVFSREVEERVAENIMTIDVNENNVTV
ncbi:MAG: transposase, partial [Thermoplasmata archaeon]